MSETEKVVLITGAARGIGLETVKRFLREGWRVVMLDRLAETLSAAARTLGSNRVYAIEADVSDPEQVTKAVEEAANKFGRLDALVNNAGIADFAPAMEHDYALWRQVMATNLDGPFLMTQAIVPHLITAGGGAIVNITSISGLRASTMRVAYGTSKAALAHLTKQYAAELGEHKIRVNAVAPGPVETDMAKKVHSDHIRKAYYDVMPIPRHAEEIELANAIWFLTSSEASYITGHVLAVDGGFDAVGIGIDKLRQ
ncbi:SDR family NAD(P)-dependent oxidoreductase [Ahrensia marina]|uniref:3-oxoacyl-ACP reductase n=1 Tax=Ahrensia marina TaxID=1514904 RepID=A0A0N0E8D5_9HYPH|nr:SDR family oxidoreductase [Ahrensia marina]KPB02215.1 3-oxoacyl-ACP reductase [Ahrensia marina]